MIFAKGRGGGGGAFSQGPGGNAPGQGGGRGFRPGPGGTCVCPACGEKAPHQQGSPCLQMKCPKCGAAMVREERQ